MRNVGRSISRRQATLDRLDGDGRRGSRTTADRRSARTAKSDLILKFKDAIGIRDEDYFEYMLTRFTEPSEIIGPIDINQLREGRYIRREQGKLPTARLAFLDEIFKSNSAILNILLTIVKREEVLSRRRPAAGRTEDSLRGTNEVPEHGELSALKDRFVLKAESLPVQNDYFTELIDAGFASEVHRTLQQKPWAEGLATLDDFIKANRYLTFQSPATVESIKPTTASVSFPTMFSASSIAWSRRSCARTHLYQRPQTRKAVQADARAQYGYSPAEQ